MSGVPVLIQCMIFLTWLTILPTMTEGVKLQPLDEYRSYILNVLKNDACRNALHTGKRQCTNALHFFKQLTRSEKTGCPYAREADCRNIDGVLVCSFGCFFPRANSDAASSSGTRLEYKIQSLRSATFPMRMYLHGSFEYDLLDFEPDLELYRNSNRQDTQELQNLRRVNQQALRVQQQYLERYLRRTELHRQREQRRQQQQHLQEQEQLEQFLQNIEQEERQQPQQTHGGSFRPNQAGGQRRRRQRTPDEEGG